MALTEEQKELIAEDINLIHSTAWKWKKKIRGNISYDDIFQICALGIIEKINKFNDKKSKFPTFAVNVMNNHMIDYLRANNKNINNLALEDNMYVDEFFEVNAINNLHNEILYDKILLEAKKHKNYNILKEFFLNPDSTQAKVADKLNYSRAYVCRVFNNFKRDMNKKYYKEARI